MKKLGNREKGFTIIEVVLVLAIAGLIFMVVFLALPGLQRGQRDTQRKQDVGRVVAQITSFQSNNKGRSPVEPTADTTVIDLLGGKDSAAARDTYNDPSTGVPYVVVGAGGTGAAPDEVGQIVYGAGNVVCEEGTGAVLPAGADVVGSSFAVSLFLEGGSAYCQEG